VAAKRSKKKSARRAKVQREFVSEAEEILERMREDLADLLDQRASCAQGGEVDPDLVNRIFRAAHSLKGLAGMFGFDGMSDLAHHLEDVLDGLRLGRMSFDASAVDLLDEAVSLFHTLLQRVDDADFEQQGADAISDLIARIRGSVNETPSEADELAGLDLDPALLRALTEYEEHRLRENLRRGRHLSLVDTTFEIIAFEGGLAELSSRCGSAEGSPGISGYRRSLGQGGVGSEPGSGRRRGDGRAGGADGTGPGRAIRGCGGGFARAGSR